MLDETSHFLAIFCKLSEDRKNHTGSPRERFRIDLVVLRNGSRLDHPGELRLLDKDQSLLHVFLTPLHPASSSASLLVGRPIVRPLLRAFRRGRLQATTLRSRRRLPDGRHRRRLMIRLMIDHGSWIRGLGVLKTRVYTIYARNGDFNAWRTRVLPDPSSFSQIFSNFERSIQARFIQPRHSDAQAFRRTRGPAISIRTLTLDLTTCTLRVRSSLDRPRTRSEPKRAVSFYHRE